jgi:broad specificity phosphatase PhoE
MERAFLTGMPGVGELILVRHGQQDFPPVGTADIKAYLDPPLSAVGERQAEAVGKYLAARPVAAVYASRLLRAAATGAAIAGHHGLQVQSDDRVREVELFRDLPEGARGPLEAYGAERMQQVQDEFVATRRWDAYPGSEGGAALRARVGEAIDEMVAAHPGDTIVVACHGGVISAYFARLLGVEEDMFFRAAHASVHRVTFLGERCVLSSLNEVGHLEGDLLTW